jgi:hypothetical protein
MLRHHQFSVDKQSEPVLVVVAPRDGRSLSM